MEYIIGYLSFIPVTLILLYLILTFSWITMRIVGVDNLATFKGLHLNYLGILKAIKEFVYG